MTWIIAPIIFMALFIGGCGDSSSPSSLESDPPGIALPPQSPSQSAPLPPSDEEPPAPSLAEQSGLERFGSAEELAAFLTELSLTAEPSGPGSTSDIPGTAGAEGPAGPAGPAAAAGSTGFSTTTIQEQGVDESDVVKTDGTHVYVLKTSHDAAPSTVRLVQAHPAETVQQVSSVPIEGFGTALYLRENMLIALSQSFGFVGIAESPESKNSRSSSHALRAGPAVANGPIGPVPTRQKTIVTVIDITNRSTPRIARTIAMDGSLVDSRLIDGKLHLILREFLSLTGNAITAEQLPTTLPGFTEKTASGSTLSGLIAQPTSFYRPAEPKGAASLPFFNPTFTTVAPIDLDDAAVPMESLAVLTAPGMLYASREALYLANSVCFGCVSFSFQDQVTELHKISLTDDGPIYVASGLVPGRPVDQFSFSEHEGFLRVATTTQPGPTNNIFVLGASDGLLELVGRLENIARTETIQSARFLGDRGFLVTFRQVDPLFTLDLSDPKNPRTVGELKVPGFSTFLLPISDTELLAIGQDADERGQTLGLQLSIFDVSNFANPILKHNITFGAQGTHSDALHDHKALTYFADQQVVAFPITDVHANTGLTFIGLAVYRAMSQTGFELLGRISTGTIDGFIAHPQYTRGAFIGNTVYAITPDVVKAAPLTDVNSAPWAVILDER